MFPYLLLPRFMKWLGLIIYLAAMFIGISYQQDLDNVNYSYGLFIQLGVLLGLLLMLGSKLKVEDEMTQHMRLVSLQWAILFYILVRVGYKCAAFYFQEAKLLPNHQINFLLLIYLIFFYSQVYFIPFIKNKIKGGEE